MPAPAALSAAVVAKDEEHDIGECLESLAFCDELIVVDSHSSDGTRDIARAHGARVIERDWPGFLGQKQFAVEQASHRWVLCLDADERVSPALRREIEALRSEGFGAHAGYSMPRLSSYLGVWVRHGSWYPDRITRLFDRQRGRWDGRDPHPAPRVDGSVGRLGGDLLHHPYADMSEHLAKIDDYTSTMAAELFAAGKRAGGLDLVTRPAVRFLRFYLADGGFRLGWRGLLLSCLAAHYGRLKYAKLLALQAAAAGETRRPAAPAD